MIKRVFKFLLSSPMTIILLTVLAIVLGVATFIEQVYDTDTAMHMVYKAKWFEFIFLLLILNLFGHIKQYNLLSRKKWAGLLFHSAFIIIIIGAGVTRYFGFEGTMPIREGETSNIIYSSEPYLKVSIQDATRKYEFDKPFSISSYTKNSFHAEFETETKGKIELDYKAYLPNAVQQIQENVPDGKDMVELIVASSNGQQNLFIENGEAKTLGMLSVGFNTKSNANIVEISEENGTLQFISPYGCNSGRYGYASGRYHCKKHNH